jgi:hypothetical protein
MQHVRIATYGINKGTFQELAETAKSGMLPRSCRSPASSATAWPTWVTGRPIDQRVGDPGPGRGRGSGGGNVGRREPGRPR